MHNGFDLIEPLGTAVLAAADGLVVVAQTDDGEQFGWRCGWYGRLIIIELDERWQDQPIYLLYGHLDAIQVAPGERVTAGQPIGALGVSGATIGAHLHFELRLGRNDFAATRNPSLWLAPSPGHGVIAGQLLDEAGRPWQGVLVTAVSQPDGAVWRNTWSYLVDPAPLANPDERLAENFVLPELPVGEYQLIVTLRGVEQRQMVTVVDGEIAVAAFSD
jgi:murein DD-endopeptidase MepM/ murein hydrolase activator NlpD